MIINIAVGWISKKTMTDLNEYITSFCPGEHSAFWVGDQVYLELSSHEALDLIRAQFPEIELRILRQRDAPPAAI
ncbi:MAG: hypothetical protein ACK4S8_14740 [Alishewanella aestuarii]